jgi:hypothetical protein
MSAANRSPSSEETTVTDIVVIAAFVVTPLSGVVMFWLALRFLWRVYKRGGSADLIQAANSLLLARGIEPNGHGRSAAATQGEERSREQVQGSRRRNGVADDGQPERPLPSRDFQPGEKELTPPRTDEEDDSGDHRGRR